MRTAIFGEGRWRRWVVRGILFVVLGSFGLFWLGLLPYVVFSPDVVRHDSADWSTAGPWWRSEGLCLQDGLPDGGLLFRGCESESSAYLYSVSKGVSEVVPSTWDTAHGVEGRCETWPAAHARDVRKTWRDFYVGRFSGHALWTAGWYVVSTAISHGGQRASIASATGPEKSTVGYGFGSFGPSHLYHGQHYHQVFDAERKAFVGFPVHLPFTTANTGQIGSCWSPSDQYVVYHRLGMPLVFVETVWYGE